MSLAQQFITKLTRLNRASTPYGKAPHKPVLLLSLLELMDKGIAIENRFYVDTELVGLFQENWRLLVDSLNTLDFTRPIYHQQSEKLNGNPFWFLQAKPGCQINSHIGSVNTLERVLDYGYFAPAVYLLLTDRAYRANITAVLLDAYFPAQKGRFMEAKRTGSGYLSDLENYVLNEPEAQYKHVKVETEEDVFVRGGLFKKNVYKIYQNTCCITGMRLQSTHGHNFIDACHIVPFSVTHDDKVSNGLALCPNLHRAFDRGLITLDEQYRVVVSKHLIENSGHPYNLKPYHGRPIHLPQNIAQAPGRENVQWHREHIFK